MGGALTDRSPRISTEAYEAELIRLQAQLVVLQEWVRSTGARVVVVFEGRDAAGKGGTIKRITQYLSPRIVRVAALPTPTERERGEWYFQRYVAHLPAAGEMVLFDRSWYNRAGVEAVMGYCTSQQHALFLRHAPVFEQMLIDEGVVLRKYWFSVSAAEQLRRFKNRYRDPLRRWKLSATDIESVNRWDDYSRAKDEMMHSTDTSVSPWFVVESDIKKHARLNMITHLLASIPFTDVASEPVDLPSRAVEATHHRRPSRSRTTFVPDHVAALIAAQVPPPPGRRPLPGSLRFSRGDHGEWRV